MAKTKKTHAAKKPAKKRPVKKKAATRKSPATRRPAPVRKQQKRSKPKSGSKSKIKSKPAAVRRPSRSSRLAAPIVKSVNGRAKKSQSKNRAQTLAIIGNATKPKERRLDPFTRGQKDRLLQLRDAMVDSMAGVAQDTLRARAEGSEASAFGMHQADAGSDAYDRDFALSLLSQEQDALYEIDEALKRIELGTYGKCEMSGKPISRARLEAIPFARFTVECQSQLEKQSKASRVRQSVTSLFGLTDEEAREGEEEEPAVETKE